MRKHQTRLKEVILPFGKHTSTKAKCSLLPFQSFNCKIKQTSVPVCQHTASSFLKHFTKNSCITLYSSFSSFWRAPAILYSLSKTGFFIEQKVKRRKKRRKRKQLEEHKGHMHAPAECMQLFCSYSPRCQQHRHQEGISTSLQFHPDCWEDRSVLSKETQRTRQHRIVFFKEIPGHRCLSEAQECNAELHGIYQRVQQRLFTRLIQHDLC